MSTDFMDELEQDAEAPRGDLGKVAALAKRLIEIDGEISKTDDHLKELKKQRGKVAEFDLPEAMQECNMVKFTLDTGQEVSVEKDLKVSVPKKRMSEIIQWLRDNKHGDVVKNQLVIDVDKGKDNSVAEVMEVAEGLEMAVVRTESVHSGTLKKILNDQLDAGVDMDLKFFGAYELNQSKIKQ
jgi:hypothetical protein